MSVAAGNLLIVISCVLWSLSGAFGKLISLPGPTLACYRVLIAGLALLPLLKMQHVRFRPAMAVMVGCFTIMNVTFISALTLTSAANAIFLQYTSPVWIALAGVLFLKESLDRIAVVSLVLSIFGVGVILWGQGAALNLGVLLALIAGVSYAGVAVSLRWLRDEDSVYLTILNMLGSGSILLAFLFFWPQDTSAGSLLAISLADLPWLAAFGVIQMGLPYVLFTRALTKVPAQQAGILTLVEPMLVPVAAWFAVGEIPDTATILGGGIILVAVLLGLSRPFFVQR